MYKRVFLFEKCIQLQNFTTTTTTTTHHRNINISPQIYMKYLQAYEKLLRCTSDTMLCFFVLFFVQCQDAEMAVMSKYDTKVPNQTAQ